MARQIEDRTPNLVFGRVTDKNNRSLMGLVVCAYDRDMRSEKLLGEAVTDRDGKYEITWLHSQLNGRELKEADLAMKVFTQENKTLLFSANMDGVRFNASPREEINIVIEQTPQPEMAEYDYLLKEATWLAGKVAIANLQESDQHRDITFLSKEMDVPAEKIEYMVVAHRLNRLSKADADFFYALLRENTLLHNNLSTSLSARLFIDISSDDQTLLYDAALVDPKKIREDINAAVSEKIVSPSVARQVKRNLEILAEYRKEAENYYQNERPQKTIEFLTSLFSEKNLEEAKRLLQENRNDLGAFFEKITDASLFASKGGKKDSKVNVALGKMLGFGNDVIPSVLKERKIKKPADIRKLARLNKAEWAQEISKANPNLKDKQLIGNYASAIVRKFEKEFPTVAFAAQLEREKKQVFAHQEKIVSFLSKHEDFDLAKHNVDLYLKEKKVFQKDKEVISRELKLAQRIFKLVPHYDKVNALIGEKIHSAQNIVSLGEKRFVNDVAPKVGLTAKEAKDIYIKAETKHTAAMLMIGHLQDSMSAMDIASFETESLALKIEAVSKDFPNLKSLFKLTDVCECEHCRSVYSPAAYLVEILQFLDKRQVVSGNAKSVLFNRRPDLGEIDLSCANAEVPIKYIDLVCELLEEVIAPDQGVDYSGDLSDGADPLKGKISNGLFVKLTSVGMPVTADALIQETESGFLSPATLPHYLRDAKLVCKIVNVGGNNYKIYRLRQTLSTAEELDAAPEYVNAEAYNELLGKAFAFKLPFDLKHTEARAYLNRFDVDRADLMTAFQFTGDPSDANIAAEKLGLANSERKIIVEAPSPNDNAAQQAYWNVPAPGDVVDYLTEVDHFLDRTGLAYKELNLLLKLEFIDKNKNLFIKHNDLTCDTDHKEITNLDLDALDRIHRFLRLQKKIGWSYETLDAIISQNRLGNGELDDACLIKAAQLKEIAEKTGIKIDELVGCFGEFPYVIHDEDAPKPLYYQVFLNKAKNGVLDEGLLPEKVDGSQTLTPFHGSLATCLQMKEKDLAYLLPLLPDNKLTFSNLSYLFAESQLIRRLKLKAEDFAVLIGFTGLDITSAPASVLEFVENFDDFGPSPLKATDVKFVLRHEATNLAEREISDDKIADVLTKLRKEYVQINGQFQSKYDSNLSATEQQETLLNTLSALSGVTAENVQKFVKFLDKDWVSALSAKQFIDDTFDEGISRTQINAAIDALDAVAPGGDIHAEQKNLIKALLDAISEFQIASAKFSALTKIVSDAFKVGTDMANAILSHGLLKQVAPGSDKIADLLSDDFANAINEANFPKQYVAAKLLHKMMYLIGALNFSAVDAEWYFVHNGDLGWFELDGIPCDTGQTAVDFSKYLSLLKAINFAKEFSSVKNPINAEQPITFFSVMELSLPASMATKDEWTQSMVFLTGYEKDDLGNVDARLFAAFDKANYRNMKNWERLLACAALMRKLGATVVQIIGFIKPTLVADDVYALRANLKSRYDEDVWLGTLKEIMDAIRPQKRDALVTYLLATNPDIKDENDLYEYFLVDVEMEACMPSSRIVLAHNSVQLFVQRCLMGLEPDAIAEANKDPNWNQWKWMKNYRVWEANRKVFLYPENWYDVTLTDDKSYLLTEFINELQQNELTNDTAEDALRRYLEKLDNIAFLEVMATWYDIPTRDMHVFARTKGGDPAIYYYRRFEKERYWTPWEKVELDITGDHLLAFMRNNRLCLAWPVFSDEQRPDQQSKVPSTSQQGTYVDTDKPERKLKIQLAISEYSNKKWQPKKVSKDAIKTPSGDGNYTSAPIPTEGFKLFFNQWFDQIVCFYKQNGSNNTVPAGIFNITGCKGYPELAVTKPFLLNFIPRFYDTAFLYQRYQELGEDASNNLAVLSVHAILSGNAFDEILGETPGTYRITYPHQLTIVDLIVFVLLYFLFYSYGRNEVMKRFTAIIPLGTLLPYFEEDSNHAYVIVPGFYRRDASGSAEFDDTQKRTASDVFQLIDDIVNWVQKIVYEFQQNPPPDSQTAIKTIITDPAFQNILEEISNYEALDFVLNFLIGKTGDEEFDATLTKLKDSQGLLYGEEFKNLYHPLVCALRTILYKDGIPGLMKRETQLQKTAFDFNSYYKPNLQIVPKSTYKQPDGSIVSSFPIEDVDFTSDGSYSLYNWDLFFRVPLHIATSLTKNQRFEEALSWFHYMFNPTGALPGTDVQKYWVTKPFYLNQTIDYLAQLIDNLMYAVSDSSNPSIKELEFAISEWRNKPFKPDVVARFRPVAYQKALLMKYIDNLVEWGDYLFRQDTMESIAQATQMYVLADKLLGPKPRIVPSPVKVPFETYNQIEAKLDSFGNALVELENILPDLTVMPEGGAELPTPTVTLSMLYFCIPHNEKMFEYWDRVADRLFKIRNCQNIDGVERSLALFAPPIDPGMLVRAAAAGLDISSVIAGINAPTPYYRFNVLSQKAVDLAQEVRSLGSSLLQALEKKDAEALSLLRSELEIKALTAVRDVKKLQINEAKEQIEVLNRTKKVTEERYKYYSNIEKIISKEQLNLDKLGEAKDWQLSANITYTLGATLALIPDFALGVSGFGGSPHGAAKFGGSLLSHSTDAIGKGLGIFSALASYEASRASILGGYDRRFNDWKLQQLLAQKELNTLEKQIKAAELRKEIAETDLSNHELQIDNAKKTDDFMRSKYTNKELYDWMIGQISSVYFRAYQLAYDFAKKAERCYRFELGNDDSFLSYGYWDSMKKGLQSADQLIHDLKRMETSYLDRNKREYELTKHVSLTMLDPLALIKLRATGTCDFDVPEALFDMDYAGQYFRRIKSVSVSLPCVAGPYTSVSAKLSLVRNKYRKNTNPDNLATTGYAEGPLSGDERFVYNIGAIQSIAASSSQSDSGVFELNFRDERYLPFEGTGAISSWRLELPQKELSQFNYETISDVIIHIKYTAREGGSTLKGLAEADLKTRLAAIKQELSQTGLHVAINMKHDMPNEWHLLVKKGIVDLKVGATRLPYIAQTLTSAIQSVMLVAKAKGNPATYSVKIDGTTINLSRVDEWKVCRENTTDISLDTDFQLSIDPPQLSNLEDLMLVVKYGF